MIEMPNELADKINALLNEYDGIRKADLLGQVAARLNDCCLGNTVPWLNGGMIYRYCMDNNVVETLKKLTSVLEEREKNTVNYNDMDCDLTTKYVLKRLDCLSCTPSEYSQKPTCSKESCERCKGTGVDPEAKDEYWIICHENHGYTKYYIISENCIGVELHIRELQYNATKAQVKKMFNALSEAIRKPCYETECKLIRYRDSRDDGFIMSMEYDKLQKWHPIERGINHECQTSRKADYAVDTVIEHFSVVIDEIKNNEI